MMRAPSGPTVMSANRHTHKMEMLISNLTIYFFMTNILNSSMPVSV